MPATVTVEFAVDDIIASMDFYENVLGFDKGEAQRFEDGRVFHGQVWLEDVHVSFSPSSGGGGPGNDEITRTIKSGSKKGTGVLLYIDLGQRDVDDYYERVTGRGARVIVTLGDRPWGHRNFTMRDLDGYVLTFAQTLENYAGRH